LRVPTCNSLYRERVAKNKVSTIRVLYTYTETQKGERNKRALIDTTNTRRISLLLREIS
jgi:hypothetical protein